MPQFLDHGFPSLAAMVEGAERYFRSAKKAIMGLGKCMSGYGERLVEVGHGEAGLSGRRRLIRGLCRSCLLCGKKMYSQISNRRGISHLVRLQMPNTNMERADERAGEREDGTGGRR